MEAPKITITEKFDIQVLICYLLSHLGKLSEPNLIEIITDDEAVNYFDLISALAQMEEKELISIEKTDGVELYTVLPKGEMMAAEFEQKIPLSVREKTMELGKKIKTRAELERSVHWHIEEIKGGKGCYFCVEFINEMGGDDIMQMKVYAPSFENALEMQTRFLRKPSDILTKIIGMFMRDNRI